MGRTHAMTDDTEAGTAATAEKLDPDTRPRRKKIVTVLLRSSDAETTPAKDDSPADDEAVAKHRDTPPDFLERFEEDENVPSATWTVGAPPPDAKNGDDVRPLSEMGNLKNLDPAAKSVIDALR